jgi:hypothetical protein
LGADSLDLHGWNATLFPRIGGASRWTGVEMAVLVILVCWVSTILYFFGRKIVVLYDVLLSLFTHFIPLGPIVLIALAVGLIIRLCPNRTTD